MKDFKFMENNLYSLNISDKYPKDTQDTKAGYPCAFPGISENNYNIPGQFSSGINATLRDLNQPRLISDSYGQLSSNIQDIKKNRKSSSFKPGYGRQAPIQVIPLPALSSPGSNMSNIITYPSSNLLTGLNLEPLSNTEELVILNSLKHRSEGNYKKVKVMFLLSTFICFLLFLYELSAIIMGIVFSNSCEMVDIFLIVSGCFHAVIIVLEWSKTWIWMQSDNAVVVDSNADHMQVFVCCVLLVLYSISIIWYTMGFAWIPSVFKFQISRNSSFPNEIFIKHGDMKYRQVIPVCDEGFYLYSITYQVIVAILLLIRVVMCCMSSFCKNLCGKLASHTKADSYDCYENNPLHQLLHPMRDPLFRWGNQSYMSPSGLNALYSSGNFSMITPVPLYQSEKSAIREIPVPTLE